MSKDDEIPPSHPPSAYMEPTQPTDIYRVGVRLPPFWPDEPAVWFAQVEGQFLLSRITDDKTKFYYVISQLDHRYAAEVKDIIVTPPTGTSYETLKSELIKRLSQSREKEVKQLLTHEELGDRRPSQFLRHLRHLAGVEVPEEFLKTIWTSRLPTHVQTAIASQPRSDLNSLADLADAVMDIVSSTPQVAAASLPSGSVLDQMSKQIAELTRKVEALSTERNRRSRSHTRHNQRNRSMTRSNSNYRRYPTCWYHSKYGSKATKCSKPCNFTAENSQGGR